MVRIPERSIFCAFRSYTPSKLPPPHLSFESNSSDFSRFMFKIFLSSFPSRNAHFGLTSCLIVIFFRQNDQMRRLISSFLGKLIDTLPGQKLGPYLPVPYFFFLGAGLEWFMINVNINGINFYEVIKRKNLEIYNEQQKRQAIRDKLNKQIEISEGKSPFMGK